VKQAQTVLTMLLLRVKSTKVVLTQSKLYHDANSSK